MAKVFFGIIRIIVRAAPIGAFGAMAFTVGAYGVGSLVNLIELIATFYLTSILFVLVVLGTIARLAGFSILRFVAYIKDELLIVLGTSSSETVLPHMIQKMERLGASKSVVRPGADGKGCAEACGCVRVPAPVTAVRVI
jgi:aerobic C4-dicarboxylate transport protein